METENQQEDEQQSAEQVEITDNLTLLEQEGGFPNDQSLLKLLNMGINISRARSGRCRSKTGITNSVSVINLF